jgi:hypothetical protein
MLLSTRTSPVGWVPRLTRQSQGSCGDGMCFSSAVLLLGKDMNWFQRCCQVPFLLRRHPNGRVRFVVHRACRYGIQQVYSAGEQNVTRRGGRRQVGRYALGRFRPNAAMVIALALSFLRWLIGRRMYDNEHSPGQEELLLDTMRMLKYTGDPWELVFDEEVSQITSFCRSGLHSIFRTSRKAPSKTAKTHSLS